MKHTLLIALLGATVTLATPTLSYADNGYKFQSKALERDHQYKHKHGHKHHHNKAQVKKDRRHYKRDKQNRHIAKPPKPHRFVKDIHNRVHGHDKAYNKHGYNKHGFNRYGYNKHGYNKHGYNKHGYNKHGFNRQGYNKHKQHYSYYDNHNNPSFSISWNVGDSTITYDNDSYAYNQDYDNYNYQKPRGKKIYKRLKRQAKRIQKGINNGELVHREVSKLRREQHDIKRTLNHYKRDGYLNRYERSRLNQLLDVASQNIYRKSHNHRTRYSQQYDNYDYYVQF